MVMIITYYSIERIFVVFFVIFCWLFWIHDYRSHKNKETKSKMKSESESKSKSTDSV